MTAETIIHSRITVAVQPPLARITLQHPPLNVIDMAMMEELAAALAEIDARSDLSAVVLTGAGKAFLGWSGCCRPYSRQSGRDAGQVSRGGACAGRHEKGDDCGRVTAIVWAEERSSPWCATSYIRLTTPRGAFPEIKLACYPPVAATALAALVGQKHAADLILTGRTISGQEAANIGLANRALSGGRGGGGGAGNRAAAFES